MQTIAGFPYWEVEFDSDGRPRDAQQASSHVTEIAQRNLSDLFIFSHGWNNDHGDARSIYRRFFESARRVLDAQPVQGSGSRAGIVGVLWPSILFPDDAPAGESGGAASLDGTGTTADAIAELAKVFPKRLVTLEALGQLLRDQPDDLDELRRFQMLLRELAPGSTTDDESAEGDVLTEDAEQVFEALSTLAPPEDRADAVGLDDQFRKLWRGAREALRVTSYWTMKERAGHVGERGVGPFVASLHAAAPSLRVHLIGHSFGARVVSFSLKGLPPSFSGPGSPVKSLTLLQGAFSHFAFADALPHDDRRSGGLKGMATRVDGPILVTHSRHDLAVSERYPQASLVTRDDAAAFDELRFRFGAMGADGAQAVDAGARSIGPIGEPYVFQKGKFINLNGDDLITQGKPPSGAHSDIFYEEIAWAVLQASGLMTGQGV
jgi:hypothetical protein